MSWPVVQACAGASAGGSTGRCWPCLNESRTRFIKEHPGGFGITEMGLEWAGSYVG